MDVDARPIPSTFSSLNFSSFGGDDCKETPSKTLKTKMVLSYYPLCAYLYVLKSVWASIRRCQTTSTYSHAPSLTCSESSQQLEPPPTHVVMAQSIDYSRTRLPRL